MSKSQKAFELAYSLYNEQVISTEEYETLMGGIDKLDTLKDRDDKIEEIWNRVATVPIDPEKNVIEIEENRFVSLTEVLAWFDARYSKGVASLLYRR